MSNIYWFKEKHFFDYSRKDETDALERQFGDKGIFLVGYEGEDPVGVLGITSRGVIRRWEPVTMDENLGMSRQLLVEGIKLAREMGIKRLRTVLRYRCDVEPPILQKVYGEAGLKMMTPGIQLITDLTNIPQQTSVIETEPATYFTLDEMTCLTLSAFATLPTDKAIHGDEGHVSEPTEAKENHRVIREGQLGETDDSLMRVAVINGVPAGFICSTIMEHYNRPRFGLIAILGVIPEYRRMGIGTWLVQDALSKFKEKGLNYGYVGTPQANANGIKLYEKNGFRPIFYTNHYEKWL